ncbi:MAG: hypothetical protein JW937_06455, partial [Candidatus Omnitrophica bacterium]|nr:hypothetical protein [Candidatus Omnitrophota bacterium]
PDLYLERMLAQDVSSSTTSRKPTVATSSRDKLATAHWLAQNPSISADQAMQSVHNQTQEILRLLGEGSDRQAVLNTWWQRLKEGIQTYPQLTGVDELETELGPGRSAVILFDPDFATYLVKHVIEPLMEKSDDILGLDSFQVAMAEASPKSLTDFDEVWELIRDEWQAYESWVDFDAGDLGVLAALWPNGLPQDVISSADLVAKAPERLQEVYDLVRAHIQATEKPLLLATAERSSSERSVLGPKGGTRADDDARRRRREEVRQQTQAAISQKNHGAEVSNGDLIPPQEDRLLLLCDLMLKSGKGGNFAELPRQNQRDIYQDRLRKELGAQILDGGLTLEDLDKDIREAEVLVANDLLRLLAEIYGIENIEAVEIHFPPSFTGQNVGTERGVLLPITALRRALASGVRFDGSSIEGMGYLDDGNRAAEIRPGSARIEEVNGRKILILEAVPKRMAEFESREGIERQPALEPRPMAPVALDQDRQAQYQQIVDYLNSHEGLDTITVFLPDLSGENREAVITQAQLEDAIQKGEELRVLVSEFGQTDDLGPLQLLTDRNTEGWTVTFDPATFAIVDLPEGDDPTGQRRTSLVATMDVGEIRDREGVIFMGSSRAIAEQIEKILAEMGMKASAATEMEWFWWIAPKGAEGSALYAEAVREVYEQDHLTPHDDGFVEALVVRAQSKGLELNPSPYFGAPYKWPNEYYDIGIDFLKAMGSWGEITEYLHIEVATGQVESPQGHGTPWEAARNTLMRKWVIRKIAERRNEEMAAQRAQAITLRAQGKTVEVPPEREIQTCTLDKPAEGVNGSGMHVHQATVVSLPEGPLPGAVTLPAGTILPFALTLPNGKSLQAGELGQATQLPQGTVIPEDAVVYVMWDAKTQDLSVMGHQYFAGAGYLFPEAMALFAVDNSWERFAPGFEAPVNYAALIFIGNRSFMVRGVEPDSEKVARAETRAAGPSRPDMLALQNFMGALGIKLKFPPAIDMRENLFDGLSDQDIIEMGIGFFPGNLEQAWQLFLDGEVLRQARKHNVLPEETIRFYQGQRLQKLTAGMEDEAGTEAQEAREVFVSTEAGEAVKHLRAGQEQGHASRFVRKAAAFALANMDPTGISPETVSVLLSALDRTQEIYEEDPEVRAAIAFALGRWAAKRLPDMRCDWDVNRLLDGLQTLHGQENALFEEAKAKGDRVGQRAYGLVRQSLAEAWHQAEVADKAVRVFQALSARTEAMSRESLAEFLLKPQKETALSEVEAKFAKKKKLKKGERKELERARRNDRMRQARIQPALIKLILAGKLQVVETAGRTDQYMLKSDVKNDVVADTEAAVRAADLIDSAL